MIYRLFGWWYRWQACKMAARSIQGQGADTDAEIVPRMWSLAVFFESYMVHGAEWTKDDFGPKEPVDLKTVKEV